MSNIKVCLNDLKAKDVTKDLLLRHHSQETYLEHYLGIPVRKGLFKSPLRDDNTPTASFFKGKSGDIVFHDFSGDFAGDFIDVVRHQNNCSYYIALKIIAQDFGIIEGESQGVIKKPIEVSKRTFKYSDFAEIRVELKSYNKDEIKWWSERGVSYKTLLKYRIYSVKSVYLNGNYFTTYGSNNYIFGYYGGRNSNGKELWRIYFPFRDSFRFLSNWKKTKLQGVHMLPKEGNDFLWVIKSMKDCACLYDLGEYGVAPTSENLFITDSQYKKMAANCKYLLLFYDNDLPGISSMNRIRKAYPDIYCIWIPRPLGAKDLSDLYQLHGKEKTMKFIQWVKKRVIRESLRRGNEVELTQEEKDIIMNFK